MNDQPCNSSTRHTKWARSLSVVAALVAIGLLTACPLEFEDLDEPQILNVTISPSQIDQSGIGGSTTFEAEISTANFDDPLNAEEARVFIENEEQVAHASDQYLIDDNIVVLEGIDSSWFQDHDTPGTYNIGAEVASDTATAWQLNLATVTVND